MKKYIVVFMLVFVCLVLVGVAGFVWAKNSQGLNYDYLIGELLRNNTDVVSDLNEEEKELLVDEMQRRDIHPDLLPENCDKQSKQKDGELDYNYYIDEIINSNGEVMNELCNDEQIMLGNEIKKQLDLGILYYGEHGELLRK